SCTGPCAGLCEWCVAPLSCTHSQARSCRPRTPYTFTAPASTGGTGTRRVVYSATSDCMYPLSPAPSRCLLLAAATYSHSVVVGSRLPFAAQYALAASQVMLVT